MDRSLYEVDRSLYEVDRSFYEVDLSFYEVDRSSYEVDRNLYEVDSSLNEVDILFYNQRQIDYCFLFFTNDYFNKLPHVNLVFFHIFRYGEGKVI